MWCSIETKETLRGIYYAWPFYSNNELLQNLPLFFKTTHVLVVRQNLYCVVQNFRVELFVENCGTLRILLEKDSKSKHRMKTDLHKLRFYMLHTICYREYDILELIFS